MAASERHETRAPLRAHPTTAPPCRRGTRHRPVCHRPARPARDSAPRPPEGRQAAVRGESPVGA
ncbi:DUF6274 family protein [Streptomyces sp. NPDC000134]|uniref:DUF6274 family protein n=1 Tax=Streptomyces sp. NPDC000134 TaxID=3364536 RepID=UPI003680E145